MSELSDKLLAAVKSGSGQVTHEQFIVGLNAREKFDLLSIVRDMERQGLIRRDLEKQSDGKRILKYKIV